MLVYKVTQLIINKINERIYGHVSLEHVHTLMVCGELYGVLGTWPCEMYVCADRKMRVFFFFHWNMMRFKTCECYFIEITNF